MSEKNGASVELYTRSKRVRDVGSHSDGASMISRSSSPDDPCVGGPAFSAMFLVMSHTILDAVPLDQYPVHLREDQTSL